MSGKVHYTKRFALFAVVFYFFLISCKPEKTTTTATRSKNCDELAQKVLKSSFEKSAKNNGSYIESIENIPGSDKVYSIDNKGNITSTSFYGEHFFSKPDIDTNDKLVCNTIEIYKSSINPVVYSKQFLAISEDKEGIYWTN